MQIACQPPALLILHGHEADGKPSQFVGSSIHFFLELSGVIADGLLQHFAVMNVGTSAVPFINLPFITAKRNRASPEPAISLISRPHAVFGFVVSPGLDTAQPVRHGLILIFGMHIVQPTKAIRRTWSSAGVVVKSIADVVP